MSTIPPSRWTDEDLAYLYHALSAGVVGLRHEDQVLLTAELIASRARVSQLEQGVEKTRRALGDILKKGGHVRTS